MTRKEPSPPSPPPAKRRGAFSEPLFWLVAGIPAATVVAGLYTLWIAHSGSDVPVGSKYVKQGLSVAPDTRREDRARALGIKGVLNARVAAGTLRIALRMDPPASDAHTPRRLRLVHPSDPGNDLSLHLRRGEDSTHWFALQPVTWSTGTRWHISIEGSDWRLPITGLQSVESIEGMRFGPQTP